MSSTNTRTFEEKNRAAVNENIEKQDSTFELKYFKLHGVSWSVRMVLAASGAKWKCIFPEVKNSHFPWQLAHSHDVPLMLIT